MDIKIVGDNGQIQESPKNVESVTPGTAIKEGVLLTEQVAQLFDFKPSEISQNKLKLNTLIEYAKTKTEDHSPEGLKWAIRNLSLKVGTPPMGEKLISYLTRYAYLDLESKKIEEEKEKFIK